MQGGFSTFFHFFYCVRLCAFTACFVSYVICLCYCANCACFLQLWLLFINKDIARVWGRCWCGGGRALRRLLDGANFRSGTVRVLRVFSVKVSQVDTPYPCPHAPSFCTTPTPRIAIHAVTPHSHLRVANYIAPELPECARTKRRGVFPRPRYLDA